MNITTTIRIYDVDKDYLNKLAAEDSEVRLSKETLRPYLFTKITLEYGKEALIPLSSPKTGKFRAKDIVDDIYDVDDLTRIIGHLEYHKMIPFHEEIATLIDIANYPDIKYRALLEKDYKYLDTYIGIDNIEAKARIIYKARYNESHYLYQKYLKNMATDIALLEKVLIKYLTDKVTTNLRSQTNVNAPQD